jgi:hypothetical protein
MNIQKEETKKRKLSKLKIALLIVICIFLTLGIVFGVYVSQYYHSQSTFAEYQKNYKVDISEENSVITLKGENENGIGIIFYPGGKVEYTAYIPLLAQLAEQGYDCYLPKMPCNLAVFGINKADKIIAAHTDVKKWYIAGHSLGGAMASSYASKNSDKLAGIIFLGAYPASDLSQTKLAMLSIVGTKDQVVNRDKLESSKSNAPKDAKYQTLEGGNHADYGDYGAQKGDGEATITREEQIGQTAEWMEAFCK